MCQIVVLEAGKMIPDDMLESACIVNPHGYGVAVPDRGRLEVYKDYQPKGNDPAKIQDLLKLAIDKPRFLHLRFSTQGVKSVDNCHPFPVYLNGESNPAMMFMHNGTVYDFKDSTNQKSDTRLFVEKVVQPLVERSLYTLDYDEVLKDDLVREVLKKYQGTSNKFVLFNSNGHSLILPQSESKKYDFGWCANEYSFNERHRSQSSSQWDSSDYDNNGDRFHGMYTGINHHKTSTKSTANTTPLLPRPQDNKTEGKVVDLDAKRTPVKSGATFLGDPPNRPSFVDLAEIDDLEELCTFSEDDVVEMVTQHPEMASVLIMDLIAELYFRNDEEVQGVDAKQVVQ